MSPRNAVIVGYDAVSPLGTDMATQWDKAVRGQSGIGALTRFALTDDFPVRVAGQVPDIDIGPYPFLSPRSLALWPSPIFKYALLVVHRALVKQQNRDHPGTLAKGSHYVQLGGGGAGCRSCGRPAHDFRKQAAAPLHQPQFMHQYGGRENIHPDPCHRSDSFHHYGLRHRSHFDDYRNHAARAGQGRCRHLRGCRFCTGCAHCCRICNHGGRLQLRHPARTRSLHPGPVVRFPWIEGGLSFPKGPAR